jgi:hypothetical protein
MANADLASFPGTVLEALVKSLEGIAAYNRNVMMAPAVILWPDKERQWEPLILELRQVLPQFLILGPYDTAARTGPAIWLKCMIARTLPEADWPAEAVPILYLPGVSRQELRAVETCPKFLQPLAELQYRGVFFSQANAKDWTILAFLKSIESGLGLDVAQDDKTREAMARALTALAYTPVPHLKGRRLEAADFDLLLTPDPVRDLLRWLNDPAVARDQWKEPEWAAFRSRCQADYRFDPEKDGELTGAELLGCKQDKWALVWERFAESPCIYPHLPELLRRVQPKKFKLFDDRSPWPKYNEEQEAELRQSLLSLAVANPQEAGKKLKELEEKHGHRRSWVWAELGQAPLAQALEPLALMAQVTAQSLGGADPQALAEGYIAGGWQADASLWQALARVQRSEDVAAVKGAISTVYFLWLEATAERLQSLVEKGSYPGNASESQGSIQAQEGECLLFADGLRFDIAQEAAAELTNKGFQVTVTSRWAALPTVTATAKPAVSPLASQLKGKPGDSEFQPRISVSDQVLNQSRFTRLLEEEGYQILAQEDIGDPAGRAWSEFGDFDLNGHSLGVKLAWQIAGQVRGLVDRISALLDKGWQQVKVVTDHGWLLLPGGLPKVDLPSYLTETRWGRCAILKESTVPTGLLVPWFWVPEVRVALAPRIACFRAGLEYAHGGLSLQECLIPVLTVSQLYKAAQVTIKEANWLGLRCRILLEGTGSGLRVDIRTKAGDPSTSIVEGGKDCLIGERASLVVEDDTWEATMVALVVVDGKGTVVAKSPTTVGGES